MSNSLLARFAENTFWLARYMERADGLARLLEVTETHARDEKGGQDWAVILEVNGNREAFRRRYGKATPTDVIHFYTLDKENSTSLISSVAMARENARSLRHLISTEMWSQVNVFHGWFTTLKKRDVQPRKLPTVCDKVKESCQAHTGITEATLYRDQAWLFYWVGKMVERADQGSRLLDVGFTRASRLGVVDENHGEHLSHWNALLRSVGGYHAFRRTHPIRLRPHEVASFVLADTAFPHSVLACVEEAHGYVLSLIDRHGLDTAKPALAILNDLRFKLVSANVHSLSEGGLHELADGLQRDLIAFTVSLGQGCFGHDG